MLGVAGGPALAITEPTAMLIGGGIGWAGGMVSCMSNSGGTGGGTGGSGGNFTARQNKINHIFGNTKRNLQVLVQRFGSREAAYDALEAATQQQVKGTGVFDQIVSVDGINVTVRGNISNSVVSIGTAFK